MWRRWLVRSKTPYRRVALDKAGRHREQKNEKLKSETKHVEEKESSDGERNTTYKYIICGNMQTVRKLLRNDIRE